MNARLFHLFAPRIRFRPAPKRGNRAGLLAHRICLVLMIIPAAFTNAAPDTSAISAAPPAGAGLFVTINHLGETEQQAALRSGQLLVHRRAADPFGNIIRGPYKALPPVIAHPVAAAAAGQPTAAAAPAVHVPTIEQAVQELPIGAVNVGAHEILVGSRSIREGDLLILESEGCQFVVWVQDIGVRGVTFCDIDMQKPHLKPFASGPKELPADSVQGISSIINLLPTDAPR
jgi:hypothetical protein